MSETETRGLHSLRVSMRYRLTILSTRWAGKRFFLRISESFKKYLLLFRPFSLNLPMMRQPLKPEREPLPGIAAAACRTGADKDLVKGDIPVGSGK